MKTCRKGAKDAKNCFFIYFFFASFAPLRQKFFTVKHGQENIR